MSTTSHATESESLAIPAGEVARLLNVSRRHLAALNASGRLPRPLRLGRSVRWNIEELRRWLAAGAPPRDKWEAQQRGQA